MPRSSNALRPSFLPLQLSVARYVVVYRCARHRTLAHIYDMVLSEACSTTTCHKTYLSCYMSSAACHHCVATTIFHIVTTALCILLLLASDTQTSRQLSVLVRSLAQQHTHIAVYIYHMSSALCRCCLLLRGTALCTYYCPVLHRHITHPMPAMTKKEQRARCSVIIITQARTHTHTSAE